MRWLVLAALALAVAGCSSGDGGGGGSNSRHFSSAEGIDNIAQRFLDASLVGTYDVTSDDTKRSRIPVSAVHSCREGRTDRHVVRSNSRFWLRGVRVRRAPLLWTRRGPPVPQRECCQYISHGSARQCVRPD